jgi:O-antigen/teichoic acid export membrane protein
MPRPDTLLRHTATLFCLRVLSLIANAAVYVGAARWQGALSFGQITSWAGLATITAVAVDCGTAARATRAAAHTNSPVEVGDAVRWRLALVPLLLCAFAITAGAPDVLPRAWTPAQVLLIGVWGWLITVQTLLSGVLIGLGRTAAGAGLFVLDKFATLMCFALISHFTKDPLVAAIAFPLGAAVGILPALRIALPNLAAALRAKSTCPGRVSEQVSFSAIAMGAQVQNLDVPIVSWLAGPTEAGLLAAPSRLTSPISIVASSVTSILFVQRRHLATPTGPAEIRQRAGITIALASASAALTALIASPLLICPSWTMSLLLGSSYHDSNTAARLVAVAMCVSSLGQPLSADLQARYRHNTVAFLLLSAGLSGTVTVLFTADRYGAVAGGLGVLVAQTAAVVALAVIWIRENNAASSAPRMDLPARHGSRGRFPGQPALPKRKEPAS